MVGRCACDLDIILDYVLSLFNKLNVVIFMHYYYQSESIVGALCAQLLLQFYVYSFETSQVFWSWSEDMVWILSSDYFGHFHNKLNLVIFHIRHYCHQSQ